MQALRHSHSRSPPREYTEKRINQRTKLSGTAIPVSKLVTLLQGQSDRIIVDKTEFTALFDINFEFSQPAAISQQIESGSPSLFTAIQDAGMKLESARAPVEVLVIDSVHKPSAN